MRWERAQRVVERSLAGLTRAFAARGVTPESVRVAALVVSVAAGIVLAVGGVVRDPLLWVVVPSLGLVRLGLHVLETRLVDFRPSDRRPKERADGEG